MLPQRAAMHVYVSEIPRKAERKMGTEEEDTNATQVESISRATGPNANEIVTFILAQTNPSFY